MVEERQDREPEDLEPDDDRDRAVDPLDPRLGVIQGRDQLTVTERPVGAAQPGIGGAHDDPDRDQPESGREGERGELLEAVHGPPFYPGGSVQTERDTLTRMSPRRVLLLLVCARPPGRRVRLADTSAHRPARSATRLPNRPPRRHGAARPTRLRHSLPILVSNAITCGKARILFLYLDTANRVASAPDRTATVAFYNLGRDPNKAVTTAEGDFVWTIEDERGMYVVDVDLPEAGVWGAEFTTEARPASRRANPFG